MPDVGGPPPPMGSLSGYGMYPIYPNIPPYGYPPDHPNASKMMPGSPMPPSSSSRNDIKEPPLDLMNKPTQPGDSNAPPQSSSKEPIPQGIPPPNQGKGLPPQFYPYGSYMPPYPYGMDPAFGPVPIMSEADKMREIANQLPQIKEERSKDSSSPNDHPKVKIKYHAIFIGPH